MKNKALLFILTTFWSISTFSQTDTTKTFKMGWVIQSGERYCNFKTLNSAFDNAGVAQLNNRVFGYSVGLTSKSKLKNTYGTATLSFFGANNDEMQPQTLSSSIDLVELALSYHFAITNSPKWLVFPYIGYGAGYGRMKITDLSQTTTFSESIADLTQNDGVKKRYPMEYPYVFANLGLGIDRSITLNNYQLFIGFSGGYKLTSKSGWGYPDLPSIRYGGFEWKLSVRIEYR